MTSQIDCAISFGKGVSTDASNNAIGFVLTQQHNDQFLPILYGGRILSDTERRYCTTDKELLAVFFCCEKM